MWEAGKEEWRCKGDWGSHTALAMYTNTSIVCGPSFVYMTAPQEALAGRQVRADAGECYRPPDTSDPHL